MRYKKFIINNYRAIAHAELPVSNNLIPVVGINESGKTSILQAVLAFDRLSDSYARGKHLEYKNKYVIGTHECTIGADVCIDSREDIVEISRRMRLTMEHEVIKSLYGLFESQRTFRVTRSLEENRQYTVDGVDVPEELNGKLAKEIYKLLPLILYFDDFTDRVPEVIRFSRADNSKGYVLRRSRYLEWQRIVEEIFIRSTDGRYTLSDFIAMKDVDDQAGLLHDVKDVLNAEIMEDWQKLKRLGGSLMDDPGDLALELKYDLGTKAFEFVFKVNDRSKDRLRVFNVTERSKGFQWFFNFLMKLKFNPKYTNDHSGAIYLLDEPGSYLHSSAQEELIRALRDISKTNSIVYCTHSQHLLDPEVTNIAQVKIASKEGGVVKLVPIGSAGMVNYQGALTPLFHALHLKTGTFNRRVGRAVITEGITDYYLFRLLLDYSDRFSFNVDLIPGAGAQQLRELISFAIAWADAYVVLLDSDKEGKAAFTRYKKFFGDRVAENFYLYGTPYKNSNVELEDYLSDADKERLRDVTGVDDIKSSLAELFYMDESTRSDYINGLDSETMANLGPVAGRLEGLCERVEAEV